MRKIAGMEEIEKFVDVGADFMVVGGAALLLQGLDRATVDVDLYFSTVEGNSEKIIKAVSELGYEVTEEKKGEIRRHKDFIQIDGNEENGLVSLDIMFFPDGFENFQEASRYKKELRGIPVMDVEGILISKKSANRRKDRLALKEIEDFMRLKKDGLRREGFIEAINESYAIGNYYEDVEGYEVADIQTLYRWWRRMRRCEKNPFVNLVNGICS